jgi:tetratricopeptide (TPR) repeat protein
MNSPHPQSPSYKNFCPKAVQQISMSDIFRSKKMLKSAIVFLVLISLSGCARDLKTRRQRLLDSGQKYMEQGKYDAASIQFRRAVQLDGGFSESYYRLGTSFLKLQRWQEAYGALQKAIALDPANVPAQLQIADLELAAKQSASARTHAEAALAADAKNASAHISLGRIDLFEKKYEDGLTEFTAAQELAPDQALPLICRADTYVLLRRYDDAIESFRAAIAKDPKLSSAYIDLAQVYRIENKPELEVSTLQEAIQHNPAAVDLNMALAALYVKQGHGDQIEPLFASLRSASNNSSAVLLAVGQFYYATGDVPRAKEILTDALARDSHNDQVQKRLVELYLSQHDWNASEQLIQGLLKVNPKDPVTRLLQARFQLAQGARTDAINTLEQLAHDSPELPLPRFYLGLAYAGKGESARAISSFNDTLERNPDFIWAYVSLGEIQNQQGNPKVALDVAKQALTRNPGFVPAILLQANAYMQMKDNATAERLLKDLSAAHSNNALILDQLAIVEFRESRYADAEQHLERSLALQPDYVPALINLVQLYQVTRRSDLILARVEKQLALAPKQASLQELLGEVQLQRGDLETAQQAFSAAIGLNPNVTEARIQLARVYQMEGKLNEAVEAGQQVVRSHPDLLAGYILLADVYQQKGEFTEAEGANQQALQRNSDYAPALNNLAWLYCEHGGNLDMALSLAQKAKEQYPTDARISDTLAWIQYRKGLYEVASQSFGDLARQFPENATYQYHFGMTLLKSGKQPEARSALKRALDLKLSEGPAQEARAALASIGQSSL